MARDILCISAAGTGVERNFNYAWDICDSRMGQLSADIIKARMFVYFDQKIVHRQEDPDSIRDTMLYFEMTNEELLEEFQQCQAAIGSELSFSTLPALSEAYKLSTISGKEIKQRYQKWRRKDRLDFLIEQDLNESQVDRQILKDFYEGRALYEQLKSQISIQIFQAIIVTLILTKRIIYQILR
jgi:hypothetical protein